MNKRKVFLWTAAAGGYIGIGMLLGYIFSDQTNNTSLWVGVLLALLGAVLLGMYISSRQQVVPANRPESGTGNDTKGTAD